MDSKKQRVIVCRSNGVAPDPRVEKIALGLAWGGMAVQILAWDRSADLPIEDSFKGLKIHRILIPASYATGIRNLPKLFLWQVKELSWLFRHRREYDIIHACDFDTVLPAFLCKLLFGKKVVYDIFDFYADHVRATPEWIKRLIRAIDLFVAVRVDGVVLANEAYTRHFTRKQPRQLATVCNSPDDLVAPGGSPVQPSASLETVPVDEERVQLRLAYVGVMQIERGLVEMFDVVQSHPAWHLDLAGFGGDEELLANRAAQISNINWYGKVPYEQALAINANADVMFATYDPAVPNHLYIGPNKIFEAMMLGKPIIVAAGTFMGRLIEREHCGLAVPYGDRALLAEALRRLAEDAPLRQQLGENARKAYEQKYSWERMRANLLELYRAL